MRWWRRTFTGFLALAGGLAVSGCYDFHLEGPEDPAPLPQPRSVAVNVEYRQPTDCTQAADACNSAVIFYGSWMRQGEVLILRPVPGRAHWVGTARDVPVNFPPRAGPYDVRVYDPYIVGTPTGGFTGRRLLVGGEDLTRVESMGRQDEHALVYVDDNGFGHNPF
jgi:hypothetical protein